MAKERGSVLMLMPAAVLVLLILGSLAVDQAAVFMGQRQLENTTAGMANDIATEAISDQALYGTGTVTLDAARAEQIVEARNADYSSGAAHTSGVRHVHFTVRVAGQSVTVNATGDVDAIFAKAVPGVHHQTSVIATATAQAVPR